MTGVPTPFTKKARTIPAGLGVLKSLRQPVGRITADVGWSVVEFALAPPSLEIVKPAFETDGTPIPTGASSSVDVGNGNVANLQLNINADAVWAFRCR